MLEKELETKFRVKIKKAGGLALKFVSPGKAGVPDRMVLAPPGRIFFVEMKRPGGKLRPLQKKVLADLRKLGFYACVIDSEDGIRDFLHMLQDPLAVSAEYQAGYRDGFRDALQGSDANG